MRIIEINEVEKHNIRENGWIIFNGKVYDITDYIKKHPGGQTTIINYLGKDVTEILNKYHSNEAKKILKGRIIGELRDDSSFWEKIIRLFG
jgi:cytochrome b involved in lipid metabolism